MASPGTVNIRRDVDDKFYRYRMPVLLTKVEGKGNGIKTVLPNIADVARALSRPPMYPTKFFGSELGAQTMFDEKAERYIVNGAHDSTRLRELLDGFIDKFVLCASCKNPETVLVLTKNEMIVRDCKACGMRTDVDMRHKLSSYIIKNPPKRASKARKESTGNGDAKNGDGEGENGGGDDGSDDELTKRINAEAAELPTAEQGTRLGDTWSADTSPEAVKARTEALAASVKKSLLLGDDDEDEGDDTDSPYFHLKTWLEENRDTATAVELYKKVQDLGLEKKHKALQTIGEYLFSEDAPPKPDGPLMQKWNPAIKKMITSDKHQKSLLGGLERYAGVDHPDLISAVPTILMAFYQADWIDEATVTQWGTHVSKKYVDKETSKKVRLAAKPFLKWLEEADDDEDEESDDE